MKIIIIEVPTRKDGPLIESIYEAAFGDAMAMLNVSEDVGIRSALKQAANDHGIPYGAEMGKFVAWGERRMNGAPGEMQ